MNFKDLHRFHNRPTLLDQPLQLGTGEYLYRTIPYFSTLFAGYF